MKKEDLIATLENYLEGNLPEGERHALETRLATDPALAEELALLRELRAMVAEEEEQLRLKAQLQTVAARHFPPKISPPEKRLKLWRRLAIAASLLLLGLAGWYYFTSRPLSDEQLFARYFSAPPAFGLYRSGERPTDSLQTIRQRVDSLYTIGQYSQALGLMRPLEPVFKENPSSEFFFQLGILYLLDEQPAKALEAFDRVQNSYQADKDWYSAWAHLRAGDRIAAKMVFEEISQSEGPYREEAAEVLEKFGF